MKAVGNRACILIMASVTSIFIAGCWGLASSRTKLDISSVVFDQSTYPVVVLGGGVAGLSAALCNKQASMPCLLIEGCSNASALAQSHAVQNWPGVMQASGGEIVNNMREQVLASSDVHLQKQDVVAVDFSSWPYSVKTRDGKGNEVAYKALSIIIAMGSVANKLNVEGESDYWGHGVGNCALCDGFLYKDKVVAVVGGGDSAVEEASYLSDIVKKVYIFVRSKQFSAKNKQALGRLLKKNNIEVFYEVHIKKIIGDGQHVNSVILLNNQGIEVAHPLDGVFLAIGSRPNTTLFREQLNLDEQGFIVLRHFQEASLPGVYAAGDISDREFVQAYTAGGDGYKAAMQATKFLSSIGFERSMLNLAPTRGISAMKEDTHDGNAMQEVQTSDDFKKLVTENDKPVFIDFFSPLCIPCKEMMPVVHKLAEKYKNEVVFVKINIANKNIDVSSCLNKISGMNVDSVPTFIFVEKGKECGRLVGTHDETTLKKMMNVLFKIKS